MCKNECRQGSVSKEYTDIEPLCFTTCMMEGKDVVYNMYMYILYKDAPELRTPL